LIEAYTKTEEDALLLVKANVVDIVDRYSKTENDALLLLKAEKSELIDSYFKTEDDVLQLLKADKSQLIDAYFQTENEALLVLKANVADLTNYVGGGDMLVSSLVIQPQLQEVRDIATGKSKAYEFSTQGELNDWMAVQDNEVTNYWWDGTDIKVLETELPDMSNVITTLGIATGGGNAITDISIDGNLLTPAKNKNFVDTDYDQSISGQKTFNTTIHSVGIMVQTYDNSSVVCAGEGARSIADIQSVSYSKSQDDALLLLKADKSTTYIKTEDDALLLQKADKSTTYTKVETNNLLNNKTDTGVSYTKGEDDALQLLKADKTQLIDSYTKSETNNLLNIKADTGVSYTKDDDDAFLLLKADISTTYTKTEDDALQLLKADKTQLIDSYTKGETNNLLNNKADTGISYTKGEDDALLLLKADKSTTYTKTEDDALQLLKADKTQLIDSYTKIETNNLLNNKANQSTTYTKTETDQLISQIDVGDVDLTDYYNKTKTDELLGEKADAIELSNYMTLGTSQTINANKTFNNACRFVSSIDGMSTVTGSSFVKSGADDTVVQLGAGVTKSISEFTGTTTDLSNYQNKTQTYSQTEANNKFVRLEGSIQQTITGRLKYVNPFGGTYDETQNPVENTYLTQSEVDAKLTNVVTTNTTQSITGAKTFNSNVSATGFAKTNKDDSSVLLAGGGDMLLSAFERLELVNISYTSNVVSPTSIMPLKSGASGASVAVCTLESAGFPKYLFYADNIVFVGSAPHIANFRFGTDGKVTITIKALSGTAGLAGAASAYINVTYPAAN
ncbi:MAG: hypothetical protein EZS28_004807, partial [Streblomastix strix]